MSALSRLFHKINILYLFLPIVLYSCKTKDIHQDSILLSETYTVIKIKRINNEVYTIYASRNDTVFKIVSYYDGQNNGGRKLKKRSCFNANLFSQFKIIEKQLNMIPPCNEYIEFHGAIIGKEPEHGIDDIWICKELNGPYLIRKEK